jgi:hypothetical protein
MEGQLIIEAVVFDDGLGIFSLVAKKKILCLQKTGQLLFKLTLYSENPFTERSQNEKRLCVQANFKEFNTAFNSRSEYTLNKKHMD